jgi:hypothetical protein
MIVFKVMIINIKLYSQVLVHVKQHYLLLGLHSSRLDPPSNLIDNLIDATLEVIPETCSTKIS